MGLETLTLQVTPLGKTVILKAGTLDQQHQRHLGLCHLGRFPGRTADHLWGGAQQSSPSTPWGDSHIHSSVRPTGAPHCLQEAFEERLTLSNPWVALHTL